jgi:hypothetical protein
VQVAVVVAVVVMVQQVMVQQVVVNILVQVYPMIALDPGQTN